MNHEHLSRTQNRTDAPGRRNRFKLVLLPGLDGTAKLFEPLSKALPETMTVQVIHYPPNQTLDYDALFQKVMYQIDTSINPGQTLLLLGESFSGPIAVRLAAALQSSVQVGLILCASFVSSPLGLIGRLANFLPLSLAIRLTPSRLLSWVLFSGQRHQTVHNRLTQCLAQVSSHVLANRLRQVMTVNQRRTLAQTHCPILYLRATRDWLVYHRSAKEVMTIRPETHLYNIPAPHLLLQACPKEASQAILSWAEGIF